MICNRRLEQVHKAIKQKASTEGENLQGKWQENTFDEH
jgi:hypothetical protein